MFTWNVPRNILCAVTMSLVFPVLSNASTLALENPGSVTYQQTQANPCVIGSSSCVNPSGFGHTTIPSNTASYTLSSPTYTVQQIRDIVGNTFYVGIAVNSTTAPLSTEILNLFVLSVNGIVQYSFVGPMTMAALNNASDFSDELLKGVDLSGFSPNDTVVFTGSISNATGLTEEFFLINPTATGVPEPSTVLLVPAALAGLVWRRMRG